jgi:hypothetical protein
LDSSGRLHIVLSRVDAHQETSLLGVADVDLKSVCACFPLHVLSLNESIN